MGWLLPTEIQEEAIPLILGGGDVMAAAETGSGKTGVWLPLLVLGTRAVLVGVIGFPVMLCVHSVFVIESVCIRHAHDNLGLCTACYSTYL